MQLPICLCLLLSGLLLALLDIWMPPVFEGSTTSRPVHHHAAAEQQSLPTSASGLAAAAAAQQPPGSSVQVIAGVMVTKKVRSDVINAFHQAAQDYNAAQLQVQVVLRFFIGDTSHPLLDKHRAIDSTAEGEDRGVAAGSSSIGNSHHLHALPKFVRGAFPENVNDGKTPAWFRWTAAAFPHSHWVLKIDTDTSVDWFSFGEAYLQHTALPLRYLGVVNDNAGCNGFPYCPPEGCTDMHAR